MRAIEQLILRGWLRLGAPRLCSHPEAPLGELTPDALARLTPAYGGEGVLADALGGALRRAATIALAEANVYPDPMALFHAQEALLAASEPFDAMLASSEPVDLRRALSMALNSVEAITGMGDPLVDGTLRVFSREVREVLPRDGPLALEPIIALLSDWIPRLPPAARAAAERDQGSAYSMLGHRDQARRLFEEAGDQARVLLEEADGALEDRQWELGGILAGLCARATTAPPRSTSAAPTSPPGAPGTPAPRPSRWRSCPGWPPISTDWTTPWPCWVWCGGCSARRRTPPGRDGRCGWPVGCWRRAAARVRGW
jgi:hypothetical protein